MAGLEFKGGFAHGGRQAAGYLMHDDPSVEARTRTKAAQERSRHISYIQPEKSHLNYDLVCTGKYADTWQRYKTRRDIAAAIDEPCRYRKDVWDKAHTKILHHKGDVQTYAQTRYRKDPETGKKVLMYKKGDPVLKSSKAAAGGKRITMITVVVYAPADIDDYDIRREWFKSVVDIFAKRYGADNIVAASVHEDEVHDYYDMHHDEYRTSRVHMHLSFVPTDQRTGKLDGHACCGRDTIMTLNDQVEQMSWEEYGCHFMTGEKSKYYEDVDDLRGASALHEEQARLERAKADEYDADRALEQQARVYTQTQERIQEMVGRMQAAREAAETAEADAEEEIAYHCSRVSDAKDRAAEAEKEAEEAEKKKEEAEKQRSDSQAEADKALLDAARNAKQARELERAGRINYKDAFITMLDAMASDPQCQTDGLAGVAGKMRDYFGRHSDRLDALYRQHTEQMITGVMHSIDRRKEQERGKDK